MGARACERQAEADERCALAVPYCSGLSILHTPIPDNGQAQNPWHCYLCEGIMVAKKFFSFIAGLIPMERSVSHACVPLRCVGPIRIIGETGPYDVMVPLATFESPLWPSVSRGAKATLKAGGISTGRP